ncbi:hypothetical protein KXW39_005906 [Aspergillus fumigatus]|nr:hypothetical protein KXV62_005164 [Aspergillus fumigatus]KAH2978687.1 hypothetical protein KXW58_004461 [Aspergillus fumigatus]KAH3047700.1 hypothetical protein KXV27_004891 [Aspergillus fumigatus]KAH3241039.1 hypothetical protein KXW23_005645 [Aspergillus fumigatus]KAH3290486.1 hypothetical protein KXW74_004601 [Aspergillus fumigatus]
MLTKQIPQTLNQPQVLRRPDQRLPDYHWSSSSSDHSDLCLDIGLHSRRQTLATHHLRRGKHRSPTPTPLSLTIQIINIISYTSLAIWDINTGWKWTCYIIAGAGYGLSGLLMAWAHEICAEDNEERALVVGSMNEMAYVFQAWLPQIVWRQVEAPEYRKGFITVTVLSGILILATFVTVGLEKRERAQKLSGATEGDSEDSLAGVDSEGDAGKV